MPDLHVIAPGWQTTIQDRGRWGAQSQGISVAGPMDPFSHRLANALVGNPVEAATIEMTIRGPELRFTDDRIVALAGAAFDVFLDQQPLEAQGRPFPVSAGSILAVGTRTSGTRGYLAIAGGIASPPVMGSRATHVTSRMGGTTGRAIATGDTLPLGPATIASPPRIPFWPVLPWHRLDHSTAADAPARLHGRLRVLAGVQLDWFEPRVLEQLQSAPYTVASDSSRMGYRLDGPTLRRSARDLISEPTPLGTLQVAPSGQPILLMADRQTTGGYPKVATVITADMGTAGQLAPGDLVSFEVVSRAEAIAALRRVEGELSPFEVYGS